MNTVPSLHLVLLHDSTGCEGSGLDYRKFREEVRKYLPHGEISESGWYIVSKDDDAKIKADLSKFLPELPSSKQATPASMANSPAKGTQAIPDPLSQRLFVIRVYHPASRDMPNADMEALYHKLVGYRAQPLKPQVAAE